MKTYTCEESLYNLVETPNNKVMFFYTFLKKPLLILGLGISLSLPQGSLAQSAKRSPAVFAFDKNFQINPHIFESTLKPQAALLVQDFYSLLKTLHPKGASVLDLYQGIKNLSPLKKSMVQVCHAILLQECSQHLTQLYFALIRLERDLEIIEGASDISSLLPLENSWWKRAENIDDSLLFLERLGLVSTQIQKQIALLDSLFLSFLLRPMKELSQIRILEYSIEQTLIYNELLFVEIMPGNYRPFYSLVFKDFINVLEETVISQNHKEFFVQELENLNFVWNDFHLKLSKGKESPSPKVLGTLQVIHQRWNSILKLVLDAQG